MTETEKTRTLFWLKRMLRDKEAIVESPSHERMAAAGVKYGDRLAREKAALQLREKHAPEIEALTNAIVAVEQTTPVAE